MTDHTRQRLGNYRLLHVLGKGSFADVYLGKHQYLKTEVAIKVLYGRMDADVIERFLAEASLLRELEHPHIVRIIDVGIEADTPYLVMEYASGGTLRTRHPHGERVPLPTVVSYVQQIASALDYAHEQKLIHRDLKPENLLIASDSRLLLSDFGVALPLRHTDSMSVQTIGGTLAYMAPEQIRGRPRAASDQYALAVMIYEWLTGTRPFSGGVAELLGQHLFVQPAALSAQIPDLPPSVEMVINRALSKDARARFEQVGDFADLLERASQGELLSLPRAVTITEEASLTDAALLAPTRKTFYNLPAQVNTLIGRETELKAVTVLLSRPEIRLLTITGAGGIGKTSLAIACVSQVLPAFRDGTCFVELASLTDPDQVVPTLIQTLGIKEQKDLPLLTSLKQVLHDKHLLLVLDNFEQVLDAAPLLLDLLQSCPELNLLVTSRAILHISGEHTFPLPPLAVPDLKHTSGSALANNASIALFIERARALKPDFELTDANALTLGKLCRELDGLPLAIELAAARITHLSPQQLLTRLSRRLDLLAQKQKKSGTPTRQQTIRQTIGWSYDLLDTREQLLLRRLSLFVGGCRLSDVEAVYELLGDDSFTVIDEVASLCDKSLIFQKADDEDEPRLHQLEIIREFAREMLTASSELESVREAHARHYASLAPLPEPSQLGLAHGSWLTFLKREYPNLLAALHFFLEQQQMEQALQLVVGMGGVWFVNGYGSEGQEELERILTSPHFTQAQIPHQLSAMTLTLIGRICLHNADLVQTVHWYRKSAELARSLTDQGLRGLSLGGLAFAEGDLGHYAEADALNADVLPSLRSAGAKGVLARGLLVSSMMWLRRNQIERAQVEAEEAVQAARAAGNQQAALAGALHVLGWIAYLQHSWEQAQAFGQESIELFRSLTFPLFGLEALCTLAYETAALGDLETARVLFEEHLTLSQEAGDTAEIGRAFCGQGYLALRQDEWDRARHLFEESIRTLLQIRQLATRFLHIVASSLEGLAVIAQSKEQSIRAAWLLGAADTLRHAKTETNLLGREYPFWDQTSEAVRDTLGSAVFLEVFKQGRQMTPLQALAAQEPEKSPDGSASFASPTTKEGNPTPLPEEAFVDSSQAFGLPTGEHLTKREIDVLRLLADGLSNAEIASQLVLSVVTVNSYLRSIYSKLGVSSRTKAARYALDHHLL